MTNKDHNYVFTSSGFRRVPLSPIIRERKRITISNIKELKEKQSNIISKNQYNRNEGSSSQYPTSFLDRRWLQDLKRMNLIERPKSVPAYSSTSSIYSEIIPINNHDCESKLLKRRVKSANAAYYNKPIKCPHIACNNGKLNHEDLTIGQKQYLWDTAKCYSVQQLKELTQHRMKCVLDYEFMKRYITTGVPNQVKINLWKEYCDYRIQIDQSVKTRRSCSSCSSTHTKSRQSSKSNSVVTAGESKCDVPKVIVTEESTEKYIENKHQNLDNGNITFFGLSGQVEGEVPIRRVRPKSAKYQKRGASAITTQTKPSSPESSQEDELVFAAEEKLSLFEKVLNENAEDTSKKAEDI